MKTEQFFNSLNFYESHSKLKETTRTGWKNGMYLAE